MQCGRRNHRMREFSVDLARIRALHSHWFRSMPLTFMDARLPLFAGALCPLDERRCEDNAHEAARNQRWPDRDDLAPARGIAVSVLIAIALWLAIVATVLP